MHSTNLLAAIFFTSFGIAGCDAQTAKDKSPGTSPPLQTAKSAVFYVLIEDHVASTLLNRAQEQDKRLKSALFAINEFLDPAKIRAKKPTDLITTPPTDELNYLLSAYPPIWKAYEERLNKIASTPGPSAPQKVIAAFKRSSSARSNSNQAITIFVRSIVDFRDRVLHPLTNPGVGDPWVPLTAALKKLNEARDAEQEAANQFTSSWNEALGPYADWKKEFEAEKTSRLQSLKQEGTETPPTSK